MKPITFLGNSRSALRDFPADIRRDAGLQLDRLQRGLEPSDWKPMPTVGSGVRELRLRDDTGAYRVIYTATYAKAVYVLHAFQKKTQQTNKRDLDLAKARLSDLKQK